MIKKKKKKSDLLNMFIILYYLMYKIKTILFLFNLINYVNNFCEIYRWPCDIYNT